jgi:glycosyltransferase involved in cell wall biosynthesis
VLAEIQGLARDFDVTVFSDRFDTEDVPGAEFVRVGAPDRPVLLRYIAFHLGMPWRYLFWRWRGGRADCVQATQGQWPGAAICYAHFCHRGYLRRQWRHSAATGVRRWARWAVHGFNAVCEGWALQRAALIVVPSRGLAREIARDYPATAAKLHVLPNPVAIEHFARPAAFDRAGLRAAQGLDDEAVVLGFMALGDFERKGLGLLLAALAALPAAERLAVRILVIGGRAGEIAEFGAQATALGVGDRIVFAGMQRDVRPFLWACDAFALPSIYEIFSLAVMQAAAAGLPVMVCEGVYGSEEFVVDGRNGWSIERRQDAVLAWLRRLLDDRAELARMGRAAVRSVEPYAVAAFQARWKDLVAGVLRGDASRPVGESA